MLLLTILLTFSTKGIANETFFVQKGEKAPITGYLFSEQQTRDIRRELLDKDELSVRLQSTRGQLQNYEHILKLKDSEIESYKTQNQRLVKLDQNNETMKYVWFGLGILVTGMAVYGAGSLSR